MDKSFLWNMEELFWYPGDEIPPVAENEKECWREYRFSDLATQHGYMIAGIDLSFGHEAVEVPSVANLLKARSFWLATVRLVNGDGIQAECHIAPAFFRSKEEVFSPLVPFDDLVLRYYVVSDRVLRPVWSSLICRGIDYKCSGEPIMFACGIIEEDRPRLDGIGRSIKHTSGFCIE